MRYVLLFLLTAITVNAQNEIPFKDEVKEIQEKVNTTWDSEKPTIVFTGSSSVRMWEDLQERFPNKQILNTGFGGSQSVDLERFLMS